MKAKTRQSGVIVNVVVVLAMLGLCGYCQADPAGWGITQITNNDYTDYSPRISGSNVVWHGSDGNDYEIFVALLQKRQEMVTTRKTTYLPDEPIVVDFENASGDAKDWIGLYEGGTAEHKFIRWLRTDGTKSGAAGLINDSVTFSPGLPDVGQYEARSFFNNSFNLEATTAFNIE